MHVCVDLACQVNGAKALCDRLTDELGPAGAKSGWLRSPCLGVCEKAPAALAFEAGEVAKEQLLAPTHAGEVIAADLLDEMLAAVAATARDRGIANIETCAAPAEQLPFADAWFDFLACRFSAHRDRARRTPS